ncbi:MAG: aspartyl-tRNA synthetase [Candidatus Peregrinibacteria bacterium Greene0416_19]|nr:MAG: aspartyl-tRNA synthetase [Candidatus Peregrinibacteria bacterium Greene0416_19]
MLRTHTCGDLRADHAGETVTLCGWVLRRRDHGGLIFVDLRDRYGFTQIVFDPKHGKIFKTAETIRPEWVLKVTGTVRKRIAGAERSDNPTGMIEVEVTAVDVLNEAKTPPFEIDHPQQHGSAVRGNKEDSAGPAAEVNEELRLQYRYLDLRRERMQRNIILRSKIFQIIRNYFTEQGCIEVDTPCLIKGTPEGAREYIVPSRLYPGQFFVLPQSPQQLKQLCMVAGLDRYFQIARCFRDEDQRGDRQPEFVQLDLEMSFCTQEDVQKTVEGSVVRVLAECSGKPLKGDGVQRYTWQDVMDRYGSDKPDLRYDLPIVDISALCDGCGFEVFEKALKNKGTVRALRVPGGAALTRSEIDTWTELAKELKAKGLAYILFTAEGPKSPLVKFFKEGFLDKLIAATGAQTGDALFFGADGFKTVCSSLGRIRSEAAKRFNLIDTSVHSLFWVTNFPMFEEMEDGTLTFSHHPFTSPNVEEWKRRKENPHGVHSVCYDLVLDGYELGSGSIRIHDATLQQEVFEMLGISRADQQKRFGHMLEAFTYGAPPHGGFAYGIDRLVMIVAGEPNIREVIAFPKDQKAKDLLLGAPGEVPERQLRELGIRIVKD